MNSVSKSVESLLKNTKDLCEFEANTVYNRVRVPGQPALNRLSQKTKQTIKPLKIAAHRPSYTTLDHTLLSQYSQKLGNGASQDPTDKWINVVYIHNGIYFSCKGKWTELEIIVFGEINQTHGAHNHLELKRRGYLVPSSDL